MHVCIIVYKRVVSLYSIYYYIHRYRLYTMSESISCNFARCAVRQLSTKHLTKTIQLPRGVLPQIVREYNAHYTDHKKLQITYGLASKCFTAVCKHFNSRWHPQEMRESYLLTFNIEAWKALTQEEKEEHTLTHCEACHKYYSVLNSAFPVPPRQRRKIAKHSAPQTIKLSKRDFSTPQMLGGKILKELTNISQITFHKTAQEVLVDTPRSKLIQRPNESEERVKRRKIEKEITKSISQNKKDKASDLVLQNRMSWRTYDKLRKTEGLVMCAHEKLPEKRKRRCGKLVDKLKIDRDKLLSEVKTWPANQNVNWSNLAREYGIHSPNGGQTIKMYLKEHNIPAASVNQRPSRAKRRCISKIGNEGVSFPMYPPVTHERQKVLQRTKEGEINIGKEVVESSYRNYSVDSKTNQVQENTIKISARKISLLEIRKKILEKHESLGILRDSSDFYFQNLSPEEVNSQLRNLGIFQCTGDKLQMLKKLCCTRHIKIWHDHSQIAAHGYLLVLASVIYDPAFFYTSKEMKELKNVTIDVPVILDNAEVHILGRSSSTTEDQLMFVETRRNCLKEIGERVFTKSGIEVIDKVRFFMVMGLQHNLRLATNREVYTVVLAVELTVGDSVT